MAEFIGNFPLALMLIPVTTGLILGGYIASYFFRRRKKSKMKLGYHSSSSAEENDASPTDEPADEDMEQVEEISTDILPPHPTSAAVSPPVDTPLAIEDKLDLGILGKSQDTTTAKPPAEKQVTFNWGASPAKSTPMVTQNPTNSSEDPEELLRLLRDPQSGQLVVEVAGQRYTKLADVTDKKVGQYILKIAAHLLAFTNGVIVTDAGMKSVYKPKLGQVPKPVESLSVSPPEVAVEPPPRPAAPNIPVPPAPPQAEPDSSTSSSIPSLNPSESSSPAPQPGGLLNRVAQPPPPPSSLPPLNLAEEIDGIVQARLRYSPLAANTFIKITSDFSGGIRINVNGTYYSSPDEVPDQQAKELIQASIKEWEHS